MRTYFFTFFGVSIVLFSIVIGQIRAVISETKKEQEAWLSIRVR